MPSLLDMSTASGRQQKHKIFSARLLDLLRNLGFEDKSRLSSLSFGKYEYWEVVSYPTLNFQIYPQHLYTHLLHSSRVSRFISELGYNLCISNYIHAGTSWLVPEILSKILFRSLSHGIRDSYTNIRYVCHPNSNDI